jgi:hypothetical protein
MISSIVIIGSLLLAALFIVAWVLRPGLRREIERPKHWFQDELRRYDRECQGKREPGKANGQ